MSSESQGHRIFRVENVWYMIETAREKVGILRQGGSGASDIKCQNKESSFCPVDEVKPWKSAHWKYGFHQKDGGGHRKVAEAW